MGNFRKTEDMGNNVGKNGIHADYFEEKSPVGEFFYVNYPVKEGH